MDSRCCEKSYEKTRRPCPRCSKPICHHCGVIARGALMCGDCSVLPPGEEDPNAVGGTRDFVRLVSASVAGISGGILGAGLWVLAGGLTGGLYVWGAVFPGLCARLGVRIAVRNSGPSLWAITLASALVGLGVGLWFTAFRDLGALFAPGAPALPDDVRYVFGDRPPTSLFDLRVVGFAIAYFFDSPGSVLFAVLIVVATSVLGPRRR